MKKSIITFAIIIMAFNLMAQNVWQQIYNGYHAQTFTRTLDKKFVFIASGYEPMILFWEVFQTDSVGNIEWDTTLMGNYADTPKCIGATNDSGYIIAGVSTSVQSAQFVKFGADNNIIWELGLMQNNYDIHDINSMAVSDNNDFVVTGIASSNIVIMKISAEGDTLWSKKYFEESFGQGQSIIESYDSGYYCLAYTTDVKSLLIKIDCSGDTLWTKNIDDSAFPVQITKTNDSCLIITSNEDNNKLKFIKTDKFGNILWTKIYTTDNTYNKCVSIANTFDNGFITANYMGPYSNPELWIMKLDENGDSLYSILPPFWPHNINLLPRKIIQTEDSLFVFLANDNNGTPRLVKTDSTGNIITDIAELVKPQTNKLNCYPNPFENEINIEFENLNLLEATLNVYSLGGKKVFSQNNFVGTHLSVNLNRLKTGTYLAELIVGNEKYSSLIEKR